MWSGDMPEEILQTEEGFEGYGCCLRLKMFRWIVESSVELKEDGFQERTGMREKTATESWRGVSGCMDHQGILMSVAE